jgi:cyanophycinase
MTGKLIIAGGNLVSSRREIHALLINYAGGANSKLAIVPTASVEDPISAMNSIEELWIELGIIPTNIIKLPIFADESGISKETQGDHEGFVQMLDGVTGIWFTGGDQYYTSKAFIRKDGSDTNVLKSMKDIYTNGGVIGGSSAGAAIMSSVMIASGTSQSAVSKPAEYGYEHYEDSSVDLRSNLRLVQGLGFFTAGVIDQHVDARPRMLRLVRAVIDSKKNLSMGYGVSEDTAMIYNSKLNLITVKGSGAICIVDCNNMSRSKRDDSFTFQNVILNVIKEGDSYNTVEKDIEFMS